MTGSLQSFNRLLIDQQPLKAKSLPLYFLSNSGHIFVFRCCHVAILAVVPQYSIVVSIMCLQLSLLTSFESILFLYCDFFFLDLDEVVGRTWLLLKKAFSVELQWLCKARRMCLCSWDTFWKANGP